MAYSSLVHLYRDAFLRHRKPNAFLRKRGERYEPVSAESAHAAVERIAAALVARGIQRGDRVGIVAETRYEWALADLGLLTAGAATVPVYATLPTPQARHMLGDSGARIVFVSTASQLEKVLSIQAEVPAIETIVAMDLPAGAGLDSVVPWEDFLAEGERALSENREIARKRGNEVTLDDLCTIIYTSGTSGTPKGVMLTHGNLVSNVENSLLEFDLDTQDTCLAILPLSHIFERMGGHYSMILRGVTIAYAESFDTFATNLREVRPTVMLAVPRIFEKVYERATEAANAGGAAKAKIFARARETACEWARLKAAGQSVPLGLSMAHGLYDRLVYKQIRDRVGGRLRLFISGGSALPREIADFFLGAGLPIFEGYGLSETSPVIAVNTPAHFRPGTVGRPVRGVEVRIAIDGEILVRGPNVMRGYWNLPQETEAALEGGWFHTGDIGRLEDGYLTITDRKKDLIATAGGKKIAPQPIEGLLRTIPYVAEAVLVGEGRPYICALIVPAFDPLENWARSNGITFGSRAELVVHPRVRELFDKEIDRVTEDLAKFERIKRFKLLDREFDLASGELTPTLKVKRKAIFHGYAATIDELYEQEQPV